MHFDPARTAHRTHSCRAGAGIQSLLTICWQIACMSTAPAPSQANASENTPGPPGKGSSMKKLILLATPLLLAAILAGLWFGGILPKLLGMSHEEQRVEAPKPVAPVFVDLPEMVANLNSAPNRPSYVKLVARVEVAKAEDADRVKAALPRLQDLFQTYLREMRPEELRGSAGIYRLREELIGRANVAVAPAKIVDVLFSQMLIQ